MGRNRFASAAALSVVAIAGFSSSALADTLAISFDPTLGRENSYNLNINYKASTGQLSVTSNNASVYVAPDASHSFPGRPSYTGGHFDLEAVINPVTGTASTGSISLTVSAGTIWNSNTLEGFGYASGLQELDFEFLQSGSSLLNGIGNGSLFGIKILPVAGYSPSAPSWTADFSANGAKNDGGGSAVPAPSTAYAGAGLLGLLGLSALARRRKASNVVV